MRRSLASLVLLSGLCSLSRQESGSYLNQGAVSADVFAKHPHKVVFERNPVSSLELVDLDWSDASSVIMPIAQLETKFLCRLPKIDLDAPQDDLVEDEDAMIESGLQLLSPLSDKCITSPRGWWVYEFCFNSKVRQFHPVPEAEQAKIVNDENNNFLGKFVASKLHPAPTTNLVEAIDHEGRTIRALRQRYGDGSICKLTGQPRTIDVEFHCANYESHISTISEPSSCHYHMVIVTHHLCKNPFFRPQIMAHSNLIVCRPIDEDVPSASEQTESVPQAPIGGSDAAAAVVADGAVADGAASPDLSPGLQPISSPPKDKLRIFRPSKNAPPNDGDGASWLTTRELIHLIGRRSASVPDPSDQPPKKAKPDAHSEGSQKLVDLFDWLTVSSADPQVRELSLELNLDQHPEQQSLLDDIIGEYIARLTSDTKDGKDAGDSPNARDDDSSREQPAERAAGHLAQQAPEQALEQAPEQAPEQALEQAPEHRGQEERAESHDPSTPDNAPQHPADHREL
ncbi:uncharacterized protein BJ171DRAFT_597295 [Polychytrium aggregatum]|uniref:uncharacterized protein n=1 Tax=Polychytrium aggregatum TaxID=110093 RepID=UPI0022FDF705|nr:uncharacterized protein BJ171DRAFT_597295 [Polychytrium aggregatum]KAI9206627.1 hypothetical protein BJ171DRAFT_597295 [Polychytrium aggregatum]